MIPADRTAEARSQPTLAYRSSVGFIDSFPCRGHDRDAVASSQLPTLGLVHQGLGVVRLRGRERNVDPNQLLLLFGGPFPMRHSGCARSPWATALTLSAAASRRLAVSVGVSEHELRGVFADRVVMQSPGLQKRAYLLVHAARTGGTERGTAIDRRLFDLFGEAATLVLGDHPAEPRQHRSVERVRIVLSARFAAPPTLDELAATARCTRSHLCRLFKAGTGLTITEYLHRLRLGEAILELSAGRSDLSTLAVRLGYASHSHFTSRFRRHFGLTPSDLRAQMRIVAAGSEPSDPVDVHTERRETLPTAGIPDHAATPSLEVRQ